MLEEDEEMMSAIVYITPPSDGTVSDGDSGEKDEGTFQNLHHQQLLAEAEAVSQHPDGKVVVGDVEESLTAPDTESDSLKKTSLNKFCLQRKVMHHVRS